MVPVVLSNTHVTADEATHGAPVTGPGIAGPFPPDAAVPSPSTMMNSGEGAPQVCAAVTLPHMDACAFMFTCALCCCGSSFAGYLLVK